jgi:HEAT repeat protein
MDLSAIWDMRRKGDIAGLVEAARSLNGSIKKEAIHTLTGVFNSHLREGITPPIKADAVEVLTAALQDEYAEVCKEASQALGLLGDPGAVEALIEVLKYPYWEDRYYAAVALGQIGEVRALPALEIALKDEYTETFYDWNNVRRKVWPVRTAAQEAVDKIKLK